MTKRLLFDPAPVEGGGTATPPAPTPAPSPAVPAPPAPPALVSLPPEEVHRLYGVARQFEEFQAKQAEAVEAQKQQALIAQAQKGEIEQAFNSYKTDADQRVATLQTTLLNRERSLVVASALTGVAFASEAAAADVRELLGLRVEAALGSDGSPVIRDKATGRPASETIREWLASPSAAHYLKPATTGGNGPTGGHRPAPAPAGDGPEPANLGEAIVALFQQQQQAVKPGLTPVGLGRRR
ncbi:MAG: hypothetical protein ABI353_16030 [Isosphaeraceae bacterium]